MYSVLLASQCVIAYYMLPYHYHVRPASKCNTWPCHANGAWLAQEKKQKKRNQNKTMKKRSIALPCHRSPR